MSLSTETCMSCVVKTVIIYRYISEVVNPYINELTVNYNEVHLYNC